MITASRPEVGEYAPAYATYIGRIAEDEDIIAVLALQIDEVLARLGRIPTVRGNYRYAPDKWSLKEIVGHLCDTERVSTYRALRIARGDTTPLPRFDDVRRATIALFGNLPAEAWHRRGTVSDEPMSVRALPYIIAGHVRHHLQILEERYTQ
jgi:hypothetical protein